MYRPAVFFELYFSHFSFVRRKLPGIWVRKKGSPEWVRFDDSEIIQEEIDPLTMFISKMWIVEDTRPKSKDSA